MKRQTKSKRRSYNKTMRGGASASCDDYIKGKKAAISNAMSILNNFARSWVPQEGHNENLQQCGDLVYPYVNEALYHLRAADDKYSETCKQKGGSGLEAAAIAERKKREAEEAVRLQKIWENRKKRFVDLFATHINLLEEARSTLNNSIDKDNICFKKCRLASAVESTIAAIAKIDDILYLLRSSPCNN